MTDVAVAPRIVGLSGGTDEPIWVDGVEGDFPVPTAVLQALPAGTRLISSVRSGKSAWTKTAKLSALLADGTNKLFFLKCITGQGARALAEGEYHSAVAINAAVTNVCPVPAGWGEYWANGSQYFFYVGDFHEMNFSEAPDAAEFAEKVAGFHLNGTSPNGMFGFGVPTVIGKMERTVKWEESWAVSFTHQLKDVLNYDNETNGPWPELEAASTQLIEVVIPRLLGALQSDGRSITPALVHGDLWENNVGTDLETGDIVIFDPGCTYAHNEMEFGTWRCTWTFYFNSPAYRKQYQKLVPISEPSDEWDDRNRLYSMHPYLTDSAGHPGSPSRQIAYNDMLYLCEKYGPLDSLERYDPSKDPVVTGEVRQFVISQLE